MYKSIFVYTPVGFIERVLSKKELDRDAEFYAEKAKQIARREGTTVTTWEVENATRIEDLDF